MTKINVYIGVENEFQLMEGKDYVDFSTRINDLLREYEYNASYFRRSNTAIRTKSGSALYADGREPEVCSAPVRVRHGFVSQAADALYLARRELVDLVSADSSLSLIGYSTHWNITKCLESVSRAEVMSALAIPYGLFTLTPLSVGINLREKSDPVPGRLELLGDYIEDEAQIRAFLLLYAGTILNFEANAKQLPFYLVEPRGRGDGHYPNPVLDGRFTRLKVKRPGSDRTYEITAQTYLQMYYELFKEGIAQLGTPEEVRNLEEFIEGRKILEIDKFKKYAFAYQLKKDDGAVDYHPEFCLDPKAYTAERALPTPLVTLLGNAANTHGVTTGYTVSPRRTESLDWDHIKFENAPQIQGIRSMELTAEFYSLQKTEAERVQAINDLHTLFSLCGIEGITHLFSSPEKPVRIDDGLLEIVGRHISRSTTAGLQSEYVAEVRTISDIIQRKERTLRLAFERSYVPQHLGDIIGQKLDVSAKMAELEAKVGEYDRTQDASFSDDPEIGIKKIERPGQRKLNWSYIWRDSIIWRHDDEIIARIVAGVVTAAATAVLIHYFTRDSVPVTPTEFVSSEVEVYECNPSGECSRVEDQREEVK